MLLEQYGAKLGERLRRRVVQRADDGFPFLYLKGEDAGAVPVRGFEAFGECLVVDETGELQNVGPGMGRPARYMAGMVRSLRRGCGGERRRRLRATSGAA